MSHAEHIEDGLVLVYDIWNVVGRLRGWGEII